MVGKKNKKRYGILLCCLLISAIGFGAVYGVEESRQKKEEAKRIAEQQKVSSQVAEIMQPKKTVKNEVATKENSKVESSTGENKKQETVNQETQKQEAANNETVKKEEKKTKETTIKETGISKPIQTDVIMDYCMDKTVYFATLDVYKYNPAMIFSAKVNDEVMIVAKGTIKEIYENEETGTTVVEDLGGGYEAVYGQLKDLNMKVGDEVVGGHVIGFVKEPTKYYVKEGANVFFQIRKDGNPVDPKDYFR